MCGCVSVYIGVWCVACGVYAEWYVVRVACCGCDVKDAPSVSSAPAYLSGVANPFRVRKLAGDRLVSFMHSPVRPCVHVCMVVVLWKCVYVCGRVPGTF